MSQDYNDKLNLPKTDFPMRASLPQNEPKIIEYWNSINLYNCLQKKSDELFVLHDGPPFANGKIHIGHCLNKILKDIILKFNSINGKSIRYIPGWDCHGLPIEHQVTKKLKSKDISKSEIRKLCHEFALKFVNSQKHEFIRLGVISDWDNPYLTINADFEANQIKVFSEMYSKGYIYRGLKPVNWSPSSQTALAEAELEYPEDHISKSVYVKFPILKESSNNNIFKFGDKINFLIWTTTPWTLPANKAVSINSQFTYGLYKDNSDILIIEKELSQEIQNKKNCNFQELMECNGEDLLDLIYSSPLSKEKCKVFNAEYVTKDTGTGIVHTAPGHGIEDYNTGVKNNLDIFSPVDQYGKFTDDVSSDLIGLNVLKEGNEKVIEILDREGYLFYKEDYNHKYPYDWRTGKPTIFRSTYQWFASVDRFKDIALKEIEKVKWFPSQSVKRISGMIKERSDWCISRQRSWGLPIPVFYFLESNEVFINDKTLDQISNIFKKEGSNSWWDREVEYFLPEEHKHLAPKLKKGNDTLDVWFDSGSSWKTVLSEDCYPADLYLEGNDQHRGWFQSSLLTSVASNSISPYKAVLTHGFVVDNNGQKMSKSKNNVVEPDKIIKQSGADILRLWVASEDYSSEVRLSDSILDGIKDKYKKLRNTFRFLLGNISDFQKKDSISFDKMEEIDQWILIKLSLLKKDYLDCFKRNLFHQGISKVLNFTASELSSIYLDIQKDILYTFSTKSQERKSTQSVISIIFREIALMLCPIISFTTEEAWKYFNKSESSIFEETLSRDTYKNDNIEAKWDRLMELRSIFLKSIELKRAEKVIGSSLESKILILSTDIEKEFLSANLNNLKKVLMVAELDISTDRVDEMECKVLKTEAPKCLRCWNHSFDRGLEDKNICIKCHQQLIL